MRARTVATLLEACAELRSVSDRTRDALEAQKVYEEIAAPSIAERSEIGDLARGVLVIVARDGAIAAKIRHLAPRLLSEYKKRGAEVTTIRVQVQAEGLPPPRRPKGAIPAAAVDSIQTLADSLPGETPLKQALARMARRHRTPR